MKNPDAIKEIVNAAVGGFNVVSTPLERAKGYPLASYPPGTVIHNNNYIVELMKGSELAARVFVGTHAYSAELQAILPFHAANPRIPDDYGQRMAALAVELNGFRLARTQEENNRYTPFSVHVSTQLSEKEIGILADSNTAGMALENGALILVPHEVRQFRKSCDHLKARAERTDEFVRHLSGLYSSLEKLL